MGRSQVRWRAGRRGLQAVGGGSRCAGGCSACKRGAAPAGPHPHRQVASEPLPPGSRGIIQCAPGPLCHACTPNAPSSHLRVLGRASRRPRAGRARPPGRPQAAAACTRCRQGGAEVVGAQTTEWHATRACERASPPCVGIRGAVRPPHARKQAGVAGLAVCAGRAASWGVQAHAQDKFTAAVLAAAASSAPPSPPPPRRRTHLPIITALIAPPV